MGVHRFAWSVMLLGICGLLYGGGAFGDDTRKPPPKKAPEKKSEAAPAEDDAKIRWGKRRDETAEDYDKRYAALLKRVKKDDPKDTAGGPVPLFTLIGHPFIVRSDISAEFTADVAMYMEMLHRDYGEVYKRLIGVAPKVTESVEVVVYESPETYLANGGAPGSGGNFSFGRPQPNRGKNWKAQTYRLSQFTAGVKDFAKWEKGTLKHEAAHMEMRLRLGVFGRTPTWFDEGQATVFEYWDFDKTVDENVADIPNRGRYAPLIRRAQGTDKFKKFDYVWSIDSAKWHADMTTPQAILNYAEAWSLAAYMINGGPKGKQDFNKIFSLAMKVGTEDKHGNRTARNADAKAKAPPKSRAWEEAFTTGDRSALEKNWLEWITKNLTRDKKVPYEEIYVWRSGFRPDVVETLETMDPSQPLGSDEKSRKLTELMRAQDKKLKTRIQK